MIYYKVVQQEFKADLSHLERPEQVLQVLTELLPLQEKIANVGPSTDTIDSVRSLSNVFALMGEANCVEVSFYRRTAIEARKAAFKYANKIASDYANDEKFKQPAQLLNSPLERGQVTWFTYVFAEGLQDKPLMVGSIVINPNVQSNLGRELDLYHQLGLDHGPTKTIYLAEQNKDIEIIAD